MGSPGENQPNAESAGRASDPSAAGPGQTFFRTVDDPTERAITADDERDRLAEIERDDATAADDAGSGESR